MESTPIERVSCFLRSHGLAGSRLVLAISGGPDSVCLLHILSGLKDEFGLTLHIAHLDHGLRQESAADADYVKQLSENEGLTATVCRADVESYRREKRLSVEEAAREVRYRFLAGVAKNLGTPYIVTGHTRNDHVETILLHIVRGTGVKGLVGLKPLTPWTVDGQKIALVRPLLEVNREETEAYCRCVGLNPRTDKTNLSLTPLRNRIRLELLPRLAQYNSDIDSALVRLSSAADANIKFLDDTVNKIWSGVILIEAGRVTLNKAALLSQSPAIQAHLLRRALEKLLGNIKDIEMRHIDNIMSTLNLPAGRRINLPYGLVFVVGYDEYWLGQGEDIPAPYPGFTGEYPLNVPGLTVIPGWQVESSFDRNTSDYPGGLIAYFDSAELGPDISVRTWRRGDRFVPFGMSIEKKLSEFMIDEKIPRHWRQNIPVVESKGQIIWLVGIRQDEKAKISDATKKVLRLEFKQR